MSRKILPRGRINFPRAGMLTVQLRDGIKRNNEFNTRSDDKNIFPA